jgi:TetR/AcrR family transcriptional repressor of nem operon
MVIVIYDVKGDGLDGKAAIMRATREKAAENRERIIAAASRLFREHGFDNVGVDAIMDSVGLTHGGFYRHFRSKDDLAAAAVTHGLAVSAERHAAHTSLDEYAAAYLSPAHRDAPGAGCLIAALGGEMARQGGEIRGALAAHLPGVLERIAAQVEGDTPAARRQQAITTLASLVGALVLARAVDDPALSDEILATTRDAITVTGTG